MSKRGRASKAERARIMRERRLMDAYVDPTSTPPGHPGLRAPVGERLPDSCRRCGTRHTTSTDVQGGLCSACRFAEQRARWADE